MQKIYFGRQRSSECQLRPARALPSKPFSDGSPRIDSASETGERTGIPLRSTHEAETSLLAIAALALMLDVSEDLLFDLCIDMEPEDGCLTVYGPGQDDTPAFTRDGIDRLRDLIAELSQFDLPLHPP